MSVCAPKVKLKWLATFVVYASCACARASIHLPNLAADTCPQIWNHTCLPRAMPIIKTLHAIGAGECCAACVADTMCMSWTVNPSQDNSCYLRGSFKEGNKKSSAGCVSGAIPGRTPPPSPPMPPPSPAPPNAKNVLMIVVDDLRPQLGAYNISVGAGQMMHTPHVDKLAARGMVFKYAYSQYAVCSPSRNSFMSGRRPDTTLTFNFKDSFRSAPGGGSMVALPQYFKQHGYNTTGCGKTYHTGHPPNFDQPYSWTEGVEYVGYNQGLGFCGNHSACVIPRNDPKLNTDDGLAARAIELLTSHKENNIRPFFVAVGFIRPHVDWSAPQEFWDLYNASGLALAKHKTAPPTAPKVAWVDGGYCDNKAGDLGHGYHFNATVPIPDDIARFWRHGYYAAVSYVDSNIGKVLTALDDLGLADDTVVAMIADHGYQLGEHSMWEKYTNWELATRVPFILAVPWKMGSHGIVSTALVESVDLYPTLAVVAGLPLPRAGANCTDTGCIEGFDASPLLDDPCRPWKVASFSQYGRCDHDPATGYYKRCSGEAREMIQVMGYSVRTEDFRYTEWFTYNGGTLKPEYNDTVAVELYDHRGDPGNDFDFYDQVNLAHNTSFASVAKLHAQILRNGWRKAEPSLTVEL